MTLLNFIKQNWTMLSTQIILCRNFISKIVPNCHSWNWLEVIDSLVIESDKQSTIYSYKIRSLCWNTKDSAKQKEVLPTGYLQRKLNRGFCCVRCAFTLSVSGLSLQACQFAFSSALYPGTVASFAQTTLAGYIAHTASPRSPCISSTGLFQASAKTEAPLWVSRESF